MLVSDVFDPPMHHATTHANPISHHNTRSPAHVHSHHITRSPVHVQSLLILLQIQEIVHPLLVVVLAGRRERRTVAVSTHVLFIWYRWTPYHPFTRQLDGITSPCCLLIGTFALQFLWWKILWNPSIHPPPSIPIALCSVEPFPSSPNTHTFQFLTTTTSNKN